MNYKNLLLIVIFVSTNITFCNKQRDILNLYFNLRHQPSSVVQRLIKNGFYTNIKDEEGNTALHWATERLEVIPLLLAANFNINIKNKWDRTPLHNCVIFSRIEAMQVLLALGADINLQDDSNLTPLDYAKDDQARAILIKNGAKTAYELSSNKKQLIYNTPKKLFTIVI